MSTSEVSSLAAEQHNAFDLDQDPWPRKAFKKERKKKKWVAVAMAIAAGPFGAHRLYLGTDTKVPVIYTVTLGGGLGLLPIIDCVVILTTRDLSKFENKDQVFLWSGDATQQ